MSYAVGVVLAIIAVIVIISALVQVSYYRHGKILISGTQLALRLVMAVLLLSIIGLSFFGPVYFSGREDPVAELIFWSLIVLLAVVVMVLAVVDLRQVRRAQHQARAKLYQHLAQLEREIKAITENKQAEDNETQ